MFRELMAVNDKTLALLFNEKMGISFFHITQS